MDNNLSTCEKHKETGNNLLKEFKFDTAIEAYTEAICLADKSEDFPANKLAIYYANRAFAHIKNESYGLGKTDAEQSVKLNPTYEKAYLRLGFLNELLQHYKQSYNAYKKAFELSGSKDKDTYQRLVNVKKSQEDSIKQKREKMLHDENERGPVKEKPYKNWRDIKVEPEYTGPTLPESGQVTSEWVEKLMENYKDQKPLHKRFTLQLIEKCRNIVAAYDSLVDVKIEDEEEVTVCGDIHGQYYDLCNIFKLNGIPAENNKYLFNGDFVDRGSFSVECIMTLIAWKCVNKNILHMTRGNHEAKQVNMVYGFKGEVEAKFKDLGVYQSFSEFFCALPLSFVFNSRIMVCHGGLPVKDNVTLQQIREVMRFSEPPDSGIMCDLLWADPISLPGRQPSKRGVSMGFGPDISEKFLTANKLDYLIRSHEVKQEGYEETHGGKVITIFSAPNYCDFTGNQAAYIKLRGDEMKPKYTKFAAVPHPNIGPMAYANQFKGMY